MLESVNIAGGRILVSGSNISFEHHITDHLGNVRVSFTDTDGDASGDIVENHHYYPFGGTMDGMHYTNGTMNPYRYQGKEYEGEEGYEMHDFGLRMYDAQLGRWHAADPANQFVSPYLAMGNNPVSLIDPDGARARWSYTNSSQHVESINRRLHYDLRDWLFPSNTHVYIDGIRMFDIGGRDSYSGGGLVNMYSAMDGVNINFASQDVTENFSFSKENGVSKMVRSGDFTLYTNYYNASIYSNASTGEIVAVGVNSKMHKFTIAPITVGGGMIHITAAYIPQKITSPELRDIVESSLGNGIVDSNGKYLTLRPVSDSDVQSRVYAGTAPVPGLSKLDPKKITTLAKILRGMVKKGTKNVPKNVKDVHIIKTDPYGKPLHGQKPHIHLKDGRALNLDGTWKHGEGGVSNKLIKWINTAIDLM